MSRRRRVKKKIAVRDPRYDSELVAKLVSTVMGDGKKSLAERIVYAAIDKSNEGSDTVDPLESVTRAVENAKPRVEVKSRRVGGATYQVPMEVRPRRAQTLAMKWIVDSAVKRNEKTMKERVASEIIDAFNNKGNAVKKREETHKMAEANRAFSHYRW